MDNEHSEAGRTKPEQDDAGPHVGALRLALHNFNSQWFLAAQGTGIVAVVLHQLHYQFHGLAIISECIWVLTMVILVLTLALYILRAICYPWHVKSLLRGNIMETACLASISIAFTTIIQMTALNLVTAWGRSWGMVVYVLWWINLAMAVSACIGITFIFTKMEAPGIDTVPVAIRLPPIAVLTVAAGGGVVCRYGELDTSLQIPVIVISYLCVGGGIMLALMCDAAFLVRLFDQSWPSGQKLYSIMIACGPYGQSSFAVQILGDVVQRGAFAEHHSSGGLIDAGTMQIVGVCSVLLGLLLWGYGTFWWAFACLAILHDLTSDVRGLLRWDRHLGAWSLVFPWVSQDSVRRDLLYLKLQTDQVVLPGCLHKCSN